MTTHAEEYTKSQIKNMESKIKAMCNQLKWTFKSGWIQYGWNSTQDKTEYIQFASTKHIEKLDTWPFNANEDLIDLSKVVSYLGGYLDSRLTFKDHVKEKKNRRAMANIIKMKSIWKFLTQDAAITLLLCFAYLTWTMQVQCSVTYQKKTLHKYQTIQKICGKIALNKSKYSSSTKALKKLHWLPIHKWIRYKILTLVFKCIRNNAPVYLQELVVIKQNKLQEKIWGPTTREHYSKYQKSKGKHLLSGHSHTQHQHYGTNHQSTSEISNHWINSRPNLKHLYTKAFHT